MSYPKRAKGWRRITVEEKPFRWCLKIGAHSNTLWLQASASSRQQVIITLKGWFDIWEFVGNFDKIPSNPPIITAKFVAQAIKFALAVGWKPEQAGQPLHLEYDNALSILSQTTSGSRQTAVVDTSSEAKVKYPTFKEISLET